MNALLLGLGATILGVFVHAVALRRFSHRWRLPALPVAQVLAFAGLALLVPLPGGALTLEDGLVALILTLSLGLAYAFLLIGVLYDSPTLALVNAIEGHGAAGMPVSALEAFAASHPFVRSRLDALIAAAEFKLVDDEVWLTGRSVHLVRLGEAYRRLRGASSSERG
ncbi:MAG: hypothetical protein GC191_04870 [Azospirillum sp.]|nr:hypothetical protein [Azospirillum sp.]